MHSCLLLTRATRNDRLERDGFIHTFLKRAVWGDIFVSKLEPSTPAKKLHILHLLNDILRNCIFEKELQATSDLQEAVLICAQSAYESQLERDKEKVLKVVNIWKERKIYSSDIIQQMTASFFLYFSGKRLTNYFQRMSPVLISLLLPPLVSLHQLLKIHTHQPLHCQIPSVPVPPVPLPASSVPAVSPPCEPPSLPQAAPTTIPAVNPAAQQDLAAGYPFPTTTETPTVTVSGGTEVPVEQKSSLLTPVHSEQILAEKPTDTPEPKLSDQSALKIAGKAPIPYTLQLMR
ncbi:hypothetical protein Pelo_1179 [Pelomyxa schiedti]|nr:hypothetical protein Pelo_1179 [Pelomyxa schiedti]